MKSTLLDLPMRLGHALLALVLILGTLNGPDEPPSAPSTQLAFPFMLQDKARPYASMAKLRALRGVL